MTQQFRARVWQQGFDREDRAKVVLEREDGQPFTIAEAQDMAKQVTTLRTTVPRAAIGRLIEAIDADVPIDDVIEDDTEFQVFLSGHLVKALRACADALAPAMEKKEPRCAGQWSEECRCTLHEGHDGDHQGEMVTYGGADALAPPEP